MSGFLAMIVLFVWFTHGYVFLRLRAAFGGGWWQLPVLVVFIGMACLLLAMRPPFRANIPEAVYQLAYTWFGCIMIATLCFASVDLLRLALFAASRLSGAAWLTLGAFRGGVLSLGLTVAVCVYAYWRALTPVPTYLAIPDGARNPGDAPLRVVVVSDVHLGQIIGPDRLERMTRLIAAQNPDIVLLAGDVVDSDMQEKKREVELLRAVAPKDGAFAILGNHEAYRGVDQAVDFLTRSGFRVLRGESATLRGITIAGVDDPALGSTVEKEKLLLEGIPRDRFILFLRHRPSATPELAGLYDLQVAGHTHGGQIWPGRIMVRYIHAVRQGLSIVTGETGESLLYVLNGTGFWGPPMRLGATPDILVIDLVPEAKTAGPVS